MANTGNTMWNGNYGTEEQARRDNYDRGNSTSTKVNAAKDLLSKPSGWDGPQKAVPKSTALALQKSLTTGK